MGTRTRPVDMHPPYDHQPLAPNASVLYPAADVVDAMVSQPSGFGTDVCLPIGNRMRAVGLSSSLLS